MTKRKKVFWAILSTAATLSAGLVVYALLYAASANELGLTASDLAMGGAPDMEVLRARTTAAADAYLALHDAEWQTVCQGPYNLNVDYSLSRRIRSLGYRSSFYYYCWDIYLPYVLESRSGHVYIVVVQVSDATAGNTHDLDSFRVLRAVVMDAEGSEIKRLE